MSDSLSDIWKLKKRGQRDAERHKELIKETIKKHGQDLIGEYNIIKSDGTKKIKVPIKVLDQYRLKYGPGKQQRGTGHSMEGKPGTRYLIKKPSEAKAGEKAGNENGENTFEAEISIDELVDILLESLDLPWMDPTNSTEIEIENEEITSIESIGIVSNLDLKRTLIQNLKRNILQGNPKPGGFVKEDLRYKVWDEEKEYHSNAVVYLMMDRSGSMDKEKKSIAKSFFFWMVQFLRRRYKSIELVFIAHDAKAFLVNEEEFFTITSDGGTVCSSAIKFAHEHIKANYSSKDTNIYLFHFSDGDNWSGDNEIYLQELNKVLPLVKAIGYGEIIPSLYPWQNEEMLLSAHLSREVKRTRFVSCVLKSRDDIFAALKSFFNVNEYKSKT